MDEKYPSMFNMEMDKPNLGLLGNSINNWSMNLDKPQGVRKKTMTGVGSSDTGQKGVYDGGIGKGCEKLVRGGQYVEDYDALKGECNHVKKMVTNLNLMNDDMDLPTEIVELILDMNKSVFQAVSKTNVKQEHSAQRSIKEAGV